MEVKPYLLMTLKELALLGAMRNRVEISSLELAGQLGSSQQTASRYLLELDAMDLIEREQGIKKQLVRIRHEGAEILEKEYVDFQHIFSLSDEIVFVGKVVSGLGEGKYYTAKRGYKEQFEEKLGFVPYPGTLNVRIDPVERNKLRLLKRCGEGLELSSFESDNRTFGQALCYHAELNGVEGAIVMPKRSHYSEIIEFVSSVYLRDALDLEDGSVVEARVFICGKGESE